MSDGGGAAWHRYVAGGLEGASPENARRAWQALAAFGAPLDALQVKESDVTQPEIVAQCGSRRKDLADIEGLGETA